MNSSGNFQLTSFFRFRYVAFVILVINHLVGVTGLNIPAWRLYFEELSALNLVLSFLLVMFFCQPLNRNLGLFCLISFMVGMTAEIVGVNTGYPFGVYHYTKTLGPLIAGVPVIIGLNWVLLSYVTAVVAGNFFKSSWQTAIVASLLMVGIDLLLEGFAIRHNFWVWANPTPPLQNYLSWFLVSFIIQMVFQRTIPYSKNSNAIPYILVLLLFLVTDLFFSLRY